MERTPSFFEIQAGEGGEDSKLFVEDLALAYCKYASIHSLSLTEAQWDHGKVSLMFKGINAYSYFSSEGGKHCVQRVPPTERNGRRQTSIVTVAVTEVFEKSIPWLDPKEVEIRTKVGSGPGGQHRNKTESCVVAKHIPTGISVTIDGRDQHSNKKTALRILEAKIASVRADAIHNNANNIKRAQVGNGGRADKIRTYNFIDSRAVDHRTNKKTSKVEDVIKRGRFDLLK